MRLYLFLLLTALVVSCSDTTKSETTDKSTGTAPDEKPQDARVYPEDRKFNDFALFISGREGSDSSSYKSLESTPEWKAFQTNLNELWKQTNDKLPTIKTWAATEMKEANAETGTLFYPFSGADFLHADLFFPNHDNIIMLALEPVGKFPDLNKKHAEGTLPKYLSGLQRAMNAILKLSFFRTIAMADDFQSEMDGTLHVIVHFMARTDHELLYQEPVAILPNGELTNDLTAVSDSAYIGNRFYFRNKGESKVKTLTYFAVNIQNTAYGSRGGLYAPGLETRTDLVNYFKKSNIRSTYLKSASYLMYRESFSIIRNLILDESEFLLQDDSGMPISFIDKNTWDLTFYGTYSAPISLFSNRAQPDLKKIYAEKTENVKPLPFGIGYQYHVGTSNLMLAKKKK